MAAAFDDTTTKSAKTELESARAQIIELKAELELERKLRKKVESIAKRMEKNLIEERRSREAADRLCHELENRVSHQRMEIERIEREMDEERRMLRIAEVIREERVQMKLEDAKLFYEEKMKISEQNDQCRKTGEEDKPIKAAEESVCIEERKKCVSEPPENPHIKRGINGFVEFPRGLRAVGSNKTMELQKNRLKKRSTNDQHIEETSNQQTRFTIPWSAKRALLALINNRT
ncbi:hypothetical protein V2J09_022521 [Rumex salicifolius]